MDFTRYLFRFDYRDVVIVRCTVAHMMRAFPHRAVFAFACSSRICCGGSGPPIQPCAIRILYTACASCALLAYVVFFLLSCRAVGLTMLAQKKSSNHNFFALYDVCSHCVRVCRLPLCAFAWCAAVVAKVKYWRGF
jgi:hypothetical protein